MCNNNNSFFVANFAQADAEVSPKPKKAKVSESVLGLDFVLIASRLTLISLAWKNGGRVQLFHIMSAGLVDILTLHALQRYARGATMK